MARNGYRSSDADTMLARCGAVGPFMASSAAPSWAVRKVSG